jgi:hypothetical protein
MGPGEVIVLSKAMGTGYHGVIWVLLFWWHLFLFSFFFFFYLRESSVNFVFYYICLATCIAFWGADADSCTKFGG